MVSWAKDFSCEANRPLTSLSSAANETTLLLKFCFFSERSFSKGSTSIHRMKQKTIQKLFEQGPELTEAPQSPQSPIKTIKGIAGSLGTNGTEEHTPPLFFFFNFFFWAKIQSSGSHENGLRPHPSNKLGTRQENEEFPFHSKNKQTE